MCVCVCKPQIFVLLFFDQTLNQINDTFISFVFVQMYISVSNMDTIMPFILPCFKSVFQLFRWDKYLWSWYSSFHRDAKFKSCSTKTLIVKYITYSHSTDDEIMVNSILSRLYSISSIVLFSRTMNFL